MNLFIDEYWEKVDHSKPNQLGHGKVLKGQYELKRSLDCGPSNRSVARLRKATKRLTRTYRGEIEKGVFKHDLGSDFGINSYQLIYLKEV